MVELRIEAVVQLVEPLALERCIGERAGDGVESYGSHRLLESAVLGVESAKQLPRCGVAFAEFAQQFGAGVIE